MQPDDCHSVPPPAHPENLRAWSLFQLFESQWNFAGLGTRCGFKYEVLLAYCAAASIDDPEDITDLIERVKVLESAVLIADYEKSQQRKEPKEDAE